MSKYCNSVDLYESLEFCKGKTVLPGLRGKVYFIPKSQIVKFPTLPDLDEEGLAMGKLAVLKGDFALVADAVFHQLDILTTASNVTYTSQGEMPSKTFVNNSTLKYAGNNEEAAGFARLANVDDLIFVVQQRDGKFRVLGNEQFETDIKPAGDSGMQVTDASGTTLEVSVTDVAPAPFYVGKLPTAEGILDCATGLIEAAA
jgi:hypothetical protein